MSVRLAVLQAPAALADVAERLDWLSGRLAKAAKRGADLALCPELFATGYNIGKRIADRAEPADGAIARTLSDMARTHGIAVHCGFAETDQGRIYNAVQCYGPDGARLVHQRKLAIPPGPERDLYSPGAGCALFDLGGMRFASLVCYDIEFVEPARHVAAQGAQVILVPMALSDNWGWVSRQMVPARAFENGVFLAYANHCGEEGGLRYLGESFVAAPDGEELARAGAGEQMLIADLDPARVAAAQVRLPYLAERDSLRLD